jgi:hypothetical protein
MRNNPIFHKLSMIGIPHVEKSGCIKNGRATFDDKEE